jgi:hypothetical protein
MQSPDTIESQSTQGKYGLPMTGEKNKLVELREDMEERNKTITDVKTTLAEALRNRETSGDPAEDIAITSLSTIKVKLI